MLRHAIAPERRFSKVSHDVVRHRQLTRDAKMLLIYVHGLADGAYTKALGEHAEDLGMKPREYYKAKKSLVECGFLHEWRFQAERGLWVTEQLISNVALTREEASALRRGRDLPPPDGSGASEHPTLPSVGEPTVGLPEPRPAGSQTPEEDREKTLPHPPTEEPAAPSRPERAEPQGEAVGPAAPEVVLAERVLLDLRHHDRRLLLGVREARGLAEVAAEWLRRGVSTADLRYALTHALPSDGIRSAVGFLRWRLNTKLPDASPAPTPAASAPGGLVACAGPGDDHVFRPVGDEPKCGRCRAAHATAAPIADADGPRLPWRALVEREVAAVRVAAL